MKKIYDWLLIQEEYDKGRTYRQLSAIFGLNQSSIRKARNRGDLITRPKHQVNLPEKEACKHCGGTFKPQYLEQIFCSRSCAASRNNKGRVRSDSSREKVRRIAIERNYGDFLRNLPVRKWAKTIETSCQECAKVFVTSDSVSARKKYCSRTCANKNRYYPNSSRNTRTSYCGISLDSGGEKLLAQELSLRGIRWLKNGVHLEQRFLFTDSFGKVRRYYPDFYLPDFEMWIEVKGKRYVRPDDDLRRASVDKPCILLLVDQKIKKHLPEFLDKLFPG